MSYLIDTNVISELRKGDRCNQKVSAWYASVADDDLFLSTLVLGEIRKGVELARAKDADKAETLERWLRQVESAFGNRVLGIGNAVADQWGSRRTRLKVGALRPFRQPYRPGHRPLSIPPQTSQNCPRGPEQGTPKGDHP